MKIYSVHYREEIAANVKALSENAVFVPEGFSWYCFAFGPLWFIAKKMWIVLAIYVALLVTLGAVADLASIPPVIILIVDLALGVVLGFEAHNLYRWSLGRKHFRERCVVAAENLQLAEQKFFAKIAEKASEISQTQKSPALKLGPL